jgi:hypothetical protein
MAALPGNATKVADRFEGCLKKSTNSKRRCVADGICAACGGAEGS